MVLSIAQGSHTPLCHKLELKRQLRLAPCKEHFDHQFIVVQFRVRVVLSNVSIGPRREAPKDCSGGNTKMSRSLPLGIAIFLSHEIC